MSPLALKVLLHYYVTPAQFDKNKAHDIELEAIAQFLRDGLLQERQAGRAGDDSYEITQRGQAYCYAALNLPLPEMKWEIPCGCVRP
jgi:hypothetical protein